MTAATVHVALVETSDALPGLLPFQAWDVLGVADDVWARDPDRHPSGVHLRAAGVELRRLEPAALDRADLDLARPGSPADRRLAKALLAAASQSTAVFLLGPADDGLAAALAGLAVDHDVEIELVFFAPQPLGSELLNVAQIMSKLRDPDGGCPWDLEQDHRSLVRYLVEETYELVAAIDDGHDDDMREELGDVLLQVMFHAQVAADRQAFSIDDVSRALVAKLVNRHPHVFGDGDADTARDVQENWDRLKAIEKGRTGVFDGVPRAMPGLQLVDKVVGKAAAVDERWLSTDPAADIRAALDDNLEPEERVGRLIAATVALARRADVDPERAARQIADGIRSEVESSHLGD
ncbi:MAG: MazG family protein [Nitriliruptoraceae bacterium]